MKRKVLARSIRSQLKKYSYEEYDSHVRIELYTAIYESDDDNLMKQLDVIDAANIQLSRDEAHIIGTLVARSRSLHRLGLNSCNSDDEILGVIARCLKEPVHVKFVDLRLNKFSTIALRSFLGHDRIESLSGNLHWKVAWLNAGRLDNEDDDVIAIDSGKGRFNIEDFSLSLGEVHSVSGRFIPFRAIWKSNLEKFLEELFGAGLKKID